jgi:Uncharacterised nucleotidyltransferase
VDVPACHPITSETEPELVARVNRLRIDAATAGLLRGFDRAGVQALLLKGPSVARWLYGDGGLRVYVDCDLLIPPAAIPAAEEVLETLTYERTFDDRVMPAWWRQHANEWVRGDGRLTVDLHHKLPGVRMDAESAWCLLAAGSEVMQVAGHPARILGLPARSLHIALHAGHHGARWSGPISDLERALAMVDAGVWRKAATLAAELDATDAFSAGLRLTSAGAEVASRLELPGARSVEALLRAGIPPPVAIGFEQFARAQGIRARAEIFWRKLVPPAEYMRRWDPRAGRGRSALLLAYVRRPAWLLRHTPRGILAWSRARRAARGFQRASEPPRRT